MGFDNSLCIYVEESSNGENSARSADNFICRSCIVRSYPCREGVQRCRGVRSSSASSHVAPPEKGYICSHCLGTIGCIKTARGHHQKCRVVCLNDPALPCHLFKGTACDACFVGALICNCTRCTMKPRRVYEATAAAAAASFHAAEAARRPRQIVETAAGAPIRNVSSRTQ
jgi:hypothetical protein